MNKKGYFSIKYVIFLFIVLTITQGFIVLLIRTYVLNEVQSTLDNAGYLTLMEAIDDEALRDYLFKIDDGNFIYRKNNNDYYSFTSNYKNILQSRYISNVNNLLTINDVLLNYRMEDFDAYFSVGPDNYSQIIIEAVYSIEIATPKDFRKNYSIFEKMPILWVFEPKMYYKSSSGDKAVYHVYSVSRIVVDRK